MFYAPTCKIAPRRVINLHPFFCGNNSNLFAVCCTYSIIYTFLILNAWLELLKFIMRAKFNGLYIYLNLIKSYFHSSMIFCYKFYPSGFYILY